MRRLLRIPSGAASHPYQVDSLSELPDSLQEPARQSLGTSERADSIFVVPAQVFSERWFGWRYVPEQALLFTSQGVLHVQDSTRPDQIAQATCLCGADLLYAQVSLLLLYGRLELAGQITDEPGRIIVEFNTVGWHFLQPALQQLLRLAWGQTRIEIPAGARVDATPERLKTLPLKFRNGLRLEGLQQSESLLGFVFQPAVWATRYRFFHRQVSAATLLALTDREMIVIEEERKGRYAAYGWILTFYPLASIDEIRASPGRAWQELEVRLTRGAVALDRRILLEQDITEAWRDIWIHHGGAWAGPNESLSCRENGKQRGNC